MATQVEGPKVFGLRNVSIKQWLVVLALGKEHRRIFIFTFICLNVTYYSFPKLMIMQTMPLGFFLLRTPEGNIYKLHIAEILDMRSLFYVQSCSIEKKQSLNICLGGNRFWNPVHLHSLPKKYCLWVFF